MSSSQSSASEASIYYCLIAFNTKIICEVNEGEKISNNNFKEKKLQKYIRACSKILKKISLSEIRRPDGMGTLISGSYSYNYIHGYEYCDNDNYPLLESLIFLCVLPLYQSNIQTNEREIAFNFLSSIRKDFLCGFANNLKYIYSHSNISDIIYNNNNNNNNSFLSVNDQNILTNITKLSHIIKQRMYGNYKNQFEYTTIPSSNNDSDADGSSSYINIQSPHATSNDNNKFIDISTLATSATSYGSISHPLNVSSDQSPSKRSRLNAFVDSIVDVQQSMRGLATKSMSLSSLVSLQSDDKFVDYETMPLIGSTSYLHNNDIDIIQNRFCITRHRKKIIILITILIIIYVIVVMFCGWNVQSCATK